MNDISTTDTVQSATEEYRRGETTTGVPAICSGPMVIAQFPFLIDRAGAEKTRDGFLRAVNSYATLQSELSRLKERETKLAEALEAGRDALMALFDVLRKEPSMQKREYVSLGIQCTKAAEKIARALAGGKP